MPRSRRRPPARPDPDASLDRLLAGWKRTEIRRGVEWTVQPVSAVQALKEYVCPGCGRVIEPGTAHVVAWRADGVLGEAAALADRRHWHNHCWRIA
ncbi:MULTISPECIES: hypothetical protein [Microbacterium]|uniref:ATP/GTP-binding protein n=1 Tax=Microbacterium sufflavum TaxID=2851649 RepID=A0ABY4IGX4_9MICO|nr:MULTISPECIES: hypothetical protein [Microbacterium]MBN6189868.1 hypothetical protein [Aneurinibacillus sp. BA2021]MCK2027282.1 hypothetical protein [Microbacterium sufflavum]UPL12017.1 hypothetical protein KV394_13235 [Microbacterium sufflavum]